MKLLKISLKVESIRLLKLIFLTSFFLFSFWAKGEVKSPLIDSLKILIKWGKADTNNVKHLYTLCNEYTNIGLYDTALYYGNSALQLAQQLNFKKGIANSYNYIGIIYDNQGNYTGALNNYFASLKIMEEINDQLGIANSCINIGIIYTNQGNYPEALKKYFTGLKICEKIGHKKTIAICLNNIGVIYMYQDNYPMALKSYLAALKVNEEIDDKSGIADGYNNLGIIYEAEKNYDEALKNYFSGLKIREEIGDKQGQAASYNNIGAFYGSQQNHTEALKNFFSALNICQEIGNKKAIVEVFMNLGEVQIKLKKLKESGIYLNKALQLAKEIGDKNSIKFSYINLSKLDSIQGKWKEAYKHHQLFMVYKDSIDNDEIKKKIMQAEMNYEFEKKEAALKAENEKKELRTEKRNAFLVSSLIFGLIVISLTASQQRTKRKKDKIIFENKKALVEQENKLLRHEKLQVEEELKVSKTVLDNYMESMLQKTALLEQFETEINLLRSKELKDEETEHRNLLKKITILTDDDWDKFKHLFEKVYTGFFTRLNEKLPDLTLAEIRLVCLSKLKLTPKQMAAILGVNSESVRTTKYRLRKKLNLSELDDIDNIIDAI